VNYIYCKERDSIVIAQFISVKGEGKNWRNEYWEGYEHAQWKRRNGWEK
jgi:hypothetical protein